ncbi:MAG: hypothetical protein WC935_00295 [Thermoleophilia bacterium]
MVRKLDYYLGLANALFERDKDLRDQQLKTDEMIHFEYVLPDSLASLDWVRRLISATPYLAFKAGRRVLSGMNEVITCDPMDNSDEARRWSHKVESVLQWNMDLAMRRRASSREDVIGSALLYDEIVGQVVHLPTQIKAIKSMGGNPRRQIAALRDGPFAVVLPNPQQVHATHSDYMLEEVLRVAVMTKKEVVDFWGDAAKDLRNDIEDDEDDWYEDCVLYDYMDHDSRAVWVMQGDAEDRTAGGSPAYVIMPPRENEYPFLPWAAVVGGTALESDAKYQRHGLLHPLWAGQTWETTNILGTLVISQAIAEMGRAKRKKIGPNPSSVKTNFSEPGIEYEVTSPNDVLDMQDHPLDPAMKEAWQYFEGLMASASVPPILMNVEANPGESYSGYNLRMQSAIGQLLPFKREGERWWEKAYELMLLWCHYSGEDLKGYTVGKSGEKEMYTLDSDEIDPDNIRIRVELVPGTPTDRLQKVNAATLLAKQANVPLRKVYEELGYSDPEGLKDDWMREQFDMAELQGIVTKIQAEASGELQQLAAQMAQGMLQQAMQQQQGMAPEVSGAMGAPPATGTPGMQGAEGMGMNPAMGGTPPAQMNPNANIMEQQTGETRAGNSAEMPV